MVTKQLSSTRVRPWAPLGIGIISICSAAFVAFVAFGSNSNLNATEGTGKLLRHVVQFKFLDASQPADIEKVVNAFRALPAKIPQVADFEYGTDNSPEGLANGFSHCFFLTFKSETDREIYLKHPEHSQFVDVLKPHLDKVQVIDYWANK